MGKLFGTLTLLATCTMAGQIGSEYHKVKYKYVYKQNSQAFDELIENTILVNVKGHDSKYSRGTGFYIGIHNNKHIFVTNHHVMSNEECAESTITYLNSSGTTSKAYCSEVLLSYFKENNSDITVFSIEAKDLYYFAGKGLGIDWDFELKPKIELATAGFGLKLRRVGRRDNQYLLRKFDMKLNFDSDCVTLNDKVYYVTNFNVANSILIGCDAIGGDSGSAVIERASGKVIGLIWGSSAKASISSTDLWNMIGTSAPELFSNSTRAILLKGLKKDFNALGIH